MIIVGWLLAALVCGLLGLGKKGGFGRAFVISLFLSPLVGFIVTLLSPEATQTEENDDAKRPVDVDFENRQNTSKQILKLYDELKAGKITDDEFQELRKKLLDS